MSRCPHSFVLPRVGGRDVYQKIEFGHPLRLIRGMRVPCGKCIVCRQNRARQWAVRLQHELQFHHQYCFITLTYDDEHVPIIEGDITLWKNDLQLFWKRLRKLLPKNQKIKYLACGEYGEKTSRPHYHAIIFGWQPEDLIEISNKIITSEILESVWKQGNVAVGSVVDETIYYVTGYILKTIPKKALGKRQREFIAVSQGMGIEYAKMYEQEVKQGTLKTNGKSAGVPLYYRKKIDIDKLAYLKLRSKIERKLEKTLRSRGKDLEHEAFKSRRQSEAELLARQKRKSNQGL